MQAYTGFAYVYDEYMDNIPYEEWCEYLVERLKEQGVTPDMEIADLGCGTGTVTQLLDKAGYSCVGIDNAPDMLTIAAEKLYESGQEIVYSLQDMRNFELPYEVDAMVSIADSMNYITSKEDITWGTLTLWQLRCQMPTRKTLQNTALFLMMYSGRSHRKCRSFLFR